MTGPALRVLVVDDSVTIRRLVSQGLDEQAGIEVVGTASNGRLALMKVPLLRPDVILMDVDMPEMNGLEAVTELRRQGDQTPVLMFSALTQSGAKVALDALARGANDCLAKPSGGLDKAMAQLRDEVAPALRALGGAGTSLQPAPRGSLKPTRRPPSKGPAPRVDALLIGSSTGGPNALGELLPKLPGDLGVPVLLTQHMPPVFTGILAERLDARSSLSVAEAQDGDALRPGHVLVAPGDFHLELRGDAATARARLSQAPKENSCRPAVDVMFRSAVACFGPHVLGVVLTGMGRDGARGAEAIVEAGGRVVTQDQASSVVYGMPRHVAEAGLSDGVHPLDELAEVIRRRVRKGRSQAQHGRVA
ncbi:MAG: chemotaxis response regulator protein-glutamate methylesterase [Myxococcota bacterium]